MSTIVHELDPESGTSPSFSVFVGKEITLSLPQLASAGYKWDVVSDDALLSVTRKPSRGDVDPEAVGSGPPVLLSVSPLVAGEHALTLEMRRPWEDAPRRRIAVTVNARHGTIFD